MYVLAKLVQVLPVRIARRYFATSTRPEVQSNHSYPAQLFVDVSVIYRNDARTGIQRVVRALLMELLKTPPLGYTVRPVFATTKQGYCYADPEFLNYSVASNSVLDDRVVAKRGDVFLALDLAANVLPRHQTQVFEWKRIGVKIHVVVYDLLPLQHPEWFNDKTIKNFKRWIKWVALFADSAVCISNTVKNQLAVFLSERFSLSPNSLLASTIVLGADICASAPSVGLPDNAAVILELLRKTPSVLMVGTLEPRKGYDQALAAFNLLSQQNEIAPLLVIVGRAGWKTENLQRELRAHPRADKQLFWLEDVSDEFLTALYINCAGVLVASRAEGFGLPLIEAILHGKHVLARDIAVFREIGSARVSFFSSNVPQELADAITDWFKCINQVNPQPENSQLPTWQTSANQLKYALGI